MSHQDIAVIKNSKKKVSFNIDIEIVEAFNKLAKIKKYNKSQTVGNLLKSFIEQEISLIK
ncbi:MAG: hypothetical protein QM490_03630 [Candidatus Gracilibacteria bacterium]